MLEQLKALADRLEGLSGPDRGADVLIACVLDGASYEVSRHPAQCGRGRVLSRYPNGRSGVWKSAHYTSSLEAVLVLVERVLPKKLIALAGPWAYAEHTDRSGEPIWYADLDDEFEGVDGLRFKAPTAPLALLRALLAAKIAEAEMSATEVGDNRT